MPRRIGPYLLQERLTPGGMGHVWRGVDTRDGRVVAVKEPALEGCADFAERANSLKRFDREWRALRLLDHPNIVAVRETLVLDSRPYIVMEYVDGETLDRALLRGRLRVPAALGIVRQLLLAAGHAHERGVVHRDIKPANVFLLPDGTVKLGDFGIAHLSEESGTATATLIASVPYMSPEQARGEPVDGRSDLFSIGIVAYELLAGVHPFKGADDQPMATVFRIVHERQRPLPTLRPEIGEALATLVERALRKDARERFASAEEMLAALDRTAPDARAQRAALASFARAPAQAPPVDPAAPTRRLQTLSPTRALPEASPPTEPLPSPTLVMPRVVAPPPPPRPAPTAAPRPARRTPAPPPPSPAPRRRRAWPALVAALAVALALAFAGYRALHLGDLPTVRGTGAAAAPLQAPRADPAPPSPPPSDPAEVQGTAETMPEPFLYDEQELTTTVEPDERLEEEDSQRDSEVTEPDEQQPPEADESSSTSGSPEDGSD